MFKSTKFKLAPHVTGLLILIFSLSAFANKPVLVTQSEVGESWPFKRPEIYIQCLDNERLIAIHASSLASYALNDAAKEAAKTLSGYKPVEDILLSDDKEISKTKSLSSIIELGKTFCHE